MKSGERQILAAPLKCGKCFKPIVRCYRTLDDSFQSCTNKECTQYTMKGSGIEAVRNPLRGFKNMLPILNGGPKEVN